MIDPHHTVTLPPDATHLTRDTFSNGRLVVYQHKTGYRFSIDAVLLAGFVRLKKADRLMDLGCGCGIISLMLAHRFSAIKIYGVEIQPSLVSLSMRNVTENNMNDRIRILERDINTLSQEMSRGPVDIISAIHPLGGHVPAESIRIRKAPWPAMRSRSP